jgi:hypothetical protein
MLQYLKSRIGERSTNMGLAAIVLAVALIVVPLVVHVETASLVSENIKWLIGALFVGGLGGVLFPDKKPTE